MKAALERWLLRRWYGGVAPGPGLRALAAFNGALVRLRQTLYRGGLLTQHRLDVPVLVVGNLVAGGAGKTPLVIALAEALSRRGWRPGVASRGHGRRSRLGGCRLRRGARRWGGRGRRRPAGRHHDRASRDQAQ